MSAGRPPIPRYGRVLAVVLPIAVAVLWFLSQRDDSGPYTLGGPLLPWTPDQVESLTLTRDGAQYRVERGERGIWRLTGAVVDFADEERIDKLLTDLAATRGGPLLAGTEPMDRRYEFNGPGAMRLTIFGPESEPWRLALGAVNPVTGFVYASGAERTACFPVETSLRQRLLEIPDEIRAQTLLPSIRLSSVERLTIGGAEELVLRRDGEGWWLRWNPDERPGPGSIAGDYQRFYADRRIENAQGRWLRAADDAISLLMYQTSSLVVRRFVPPSEADPNLEAWGLRPPLRRIVLEGPGLRAGNLEKRVEIDFGPSLDGEVVAVRRLENVMLADDTALKKLELRPVDLLGLEVLSHPVVRADSFTVFVDEQLVLAGHRDAGLYAHELDVQKGDADRVDGRQAWIADYPVPGPTVDPGRMDVRLQTAVVALDRVPILAVFPPQREPEALAPNGRVRIEIERACGDETCRETLVLGTLLPDRLPAGSPAEARDPEGAAPAAVWFPRTGQLLQVPAAALTTLRNLAL